MSRSVALGPSRSTQASHTATIGTYALRSHWSVAYPPLPRGFIQQIEEITEGPTIVEVDLNADGLSDAAFDSEFVLVVDSEFSALGPSVVAFVGASTFSSVLNAPGAAMVNFQASSTGLVFADFNSAGVATVVWQSAVLVTLAANLNSAGAATVQFASTTFFSGILNAPGGATVNFVGQALAGAVLPTDFHAVGVATVAFDVAVVAGSAPTVLNAVGQSLVLFFGEDANAPVGTPGNLFVPIRYVIGEMANVVPVQTVLVGGIDVVPVREFLGPANVVPVRETSTERPRVKVVKV